VANATDIKDRIVFDDSQLAIEVYGELNSHLKIIEGELSVELHARGNELSLVGASDDVAVARALLEQLYAMAKKGQSLEPPDITRAVNILRGDRNVKLRDVFSDNVLAGSPRSRPIAPKGLAQKKYVDAIRQRDIVFGIGPAGTGKTYLAMAMAVRYLIDKVVKRIVLCRPAVEAGEKLGFLPGTMAEKVNPYLRPLYDALHDMVDFDRAEQLIERGVIEVAPLAFMRGRTLNDAFVILDEAQNSTTEQMKMFLTRLGFGSKAIITGDVTQIDLPTGQRSGLREAQAILDGVDGISFCYFTEVDVVRHPLVQKIIRAYDKLDAEKRAAKDAPKP
jgi:phosphate starvation-inducible PhoH-like protein